MQSKILLINFTENEAEKLKDLPLIVDRGYLSDVRGKIKSREEIGSTIKCFFPLSIHEYKAVFINFQNNSAIDKEFEKKAEPFIFRKINEFIDYWLTKGNPVIVFLGDYSSRAMLSVGIRGINLENVTNRDVTVNCVSDDFSKFFDKVKKEVVMPTQKYIEVGTEEDDFYVEHKDSDFQVRGIYCNKAGDLLGCYHSNSRYSYECKPSLFLLPQFRNNSIIIKGILKELSKIYKKHLSELYEPDWRDSDRYYPKEIQVYDEKIDSLIESAELKIKELKRAKEKAKEKYIALVKLLTAKDEELKEAVISVLRNIFQLKIIDVDRQKGSTIAHEDIIIELPDKSILGEVKGDGSKYPSTRHIAQLWKHLKHNNEIETGALILNYDINAAPEDRGLAYKGEEEQDLEQIIFIDTRVLHDVAMAVIDHEMPISEAIDILFQEGRSQFALTEYLKYKEEQAQLSNNKEETSSQQK
ncbi:MAG: hypothetical protein KJI71_01805 [Patescibacteria group bacterium]|nr:hypothetical protein [Patescibacteria group bacterium]